jgi:oxalate decarboxylase/phosphoglucose isomerase-like protein (cupin superfamily)
VSLAPASGEMFHIPTGSLHTIENVGDQDAKLIIVFSHEKPEDFSLRRAGFCDRENGADLIDCTALAIRGPHQK